MARCKVVLEDSFKRALVQLPERAQDQVAVVVQSLENECGFDPDPAQSILQVGKYISFCEHVEGWGCSISLVPGGWHHCRERSAFYSHPAQSAQR